MTPRSTSPLSVGLLFATALLLISFGTSLGQTTAARPDRGTMPNGSYAVSDIENVNLQNGNVNLSIPLAALPSVAGGKLSWVLKAQYNSKLWNLTRTQAAGEGADNEYHPYVIDTPQLSELGGWRIGGQYEITVRYAQEDFDYHIPPPDSIPYADYQLLVNYSWYKVVLTIPDGSEHELRPLDYQPYSGGQDFLKGYFKESPYQNGTMRYYSFDGSFLYAEITSEQNWKVFMPDGTQIIQTTDGTQRIQDTNGNKIKIFSNVNGTHYQDEQTGREIRYSYNPSGNGGQGQGQVWYQTVGGTWVHIDINFGSTQVQGQVYKVKDWVPYQFSPNPCQRYNELNQEIPVVREIVLPQTVPSVTRKFTFNYNSDTIETATTPLVNWTCGSSPQSYTRQASKGWGSLNQVVTPSGAVIAYSYSLDAFHSPLLTDNLAEESITQKQLTHDGTIDTWTYSVTNTIGAVTNPDGSTITENKFSHNPGYAHSFGKAGLVFRTTRPFTRIERHWTDLQFSGASIDSPGGPVNFNSVVDVEYTTLLDAANNPLKMSAKAFQYDYNGNVVQETDYDWFDPALVSRDTNGVPTAVPASATVLRVVSNNYHNPAVSSSSGNVYAKRSLSTGTPLILNAPQQTTVGPAITRFTYDGFSYGTAPTAGNVTNIGRLDNRGDSNTSNDVWINVGHTYGAYGNLATTTDARGNVTQFFYDDATHALPTRVVVDPENGTGQQTTATAYDYSTGLVTGVTDPNGTTSTTDYTNQLLGTVDPFGRPGVLIGPALTINGATHHQRVKSVYQDSLRKVTVTSDLSAENDGLLKSETLYDQLGRTTETRQYETATTYITVKRTYDSMGRVKQVSNPYRSGSTVVWTTTAYDAVGRVLTVTAPDGAVTNSSYSGNQATVADQAGKDRQSMTDALGRLTQVIEDPGTGGLGYVSTYAYDTLGNMKTVIQGSQTRTFTYDSLSRLKTAVNPESGTISYVYDNNGNLTQKTDARPITTTFTYDALNRLTLKNYGDTTPDVAYFYDSQALPAGAPSFVRGLSTGRLVAVTTGGTSAGSYYGYDALGHILRRIQRTDSVNYLVEATYNLAGARLTETYPSMPGATDRRTVSYSFDTAGRLSSLTSAATTYAPGASVTGVSYAAHGGLSSETLGNNLIHALTYNNRLQPTQIKLGTSTSPTSVLNLTYNYGTTANNGNVLDATHKIGAWTTKQIYTYDSLNRLDSTAETNGSTTTYWTEDNAYDRYGNRWEVVSGIPSLSFNSQNRIVGYTYDAVGNLTNDTAHTYGYDAENRVKTVDGVANTYQYDGEGNRVKKYFPLGEQVRLVYGISAELIAEFDTVTGALEREHVYGAGRLLATIEPVNGTSYATADQLGSPRVVTSSTGTVVSRHDYRPFGRELMVGEGGRTAAQGFGVNDSLREKFASYERDAETGFDYAQARYYSSMMGRFTSTDPITMTVDRLYDPQQINLYAYCRNNPLAFVDPTGEIIDFTNAEARKAFDEYEELLNKDPEKYASELATLDQLKNSDVTYVVNLGGKVTANGEGELTTDGSKIFVNVNNVGGLSGENFSLNSRLGHELEHARQFDSGELSFATDMAGEWAASPASYDIGDEVKAWKVQQKLATNTDYFTREGGETKPSLLRKFANAQTDDERAGVLSRSAYPHRNQRRDTNVVFGSESGHKPGQLIRTSSFFGRVNRVIERPK